MICMSVSLSDAVLVAVRQHGQKAGALDGGGDLALIDGTGAGQAGRNDLAVFGNGSGTSSRLSGRDLY